MRLAVGALLLLDHDGTGLLKATDPELAVVTLEAPLLLRVVLDAEVAVEASQTKVDHLVCCGAQLADLVTQQ